MLVISVHTDVTSYNEISITIIYYECVFAENISKKNTAWEANLSAESEMLLKSSDILLFVNDLTGFCV